MSRLTTSRTRLRPLTGDDFAPLHELMTSAGVRRYLWDDEIITADETRALLETNERLFAQRGYGLWGAFDKVSGRLIGFCGLWHFRTPPALEFLFGVDERHWRCGLGTELGRAIMSHLFDVHQMPCITGSTDATNAASRRALEKCGFEFERRETVDGLDTCFYVRRNPEA